MTVFGTPLCPDTPEIRLTILPYGTSPGRERAEIIFVRSNHRSPVLPLSASRTPWYHRARIRLG